MASAVALACLLPQRAFAQSSTSLLTDATVLPRHGFEIGVQSRWTRFDQLLGGRLGNRPLGSNFSTDSLGTAQLASFGPSENAIRALTGNSAFRLTAGQLTTSANSRIVTAPLIVEYGLTSRITLGVVVPLVETRTVLVSRLNPRLGFANVGPNPNLIGNNYGATAALVQSFTTAAANLQTLLTQCQAAPSNAGCSAVLSDAPQLLSSSTAFANAIAALYGTDQATHPGQEYVPLTGSDLQKSINKQLQTFRAGYQTLLNTSAIADTSIAGAGGPAANAQLDTILAHAGYDTLGIADHSSIGDISIGATFQLANTFGDTIAAASGATMYRLAVNGTARIGTGQPGNRNRLFDNATGYGQPGVVVGAAGDVRFRRRYSLTGIASYTAQFGSVDVARIPNFENNIFPLGTPLSGTYSAGNTLSITAIPRVEIARFFSLSGQYQYLNVAADTYTPAGPGVSTAVFTSPPGMAAASAQQIGVGVAYSTVSSGEAGPGRLPFEVSFRHLETIAATGGPYPKTFQDQLSLRVYFGGK